MSEPKIPAVAKKTISKPVTKAAPASTSKTVELTMDKECKGSIRYVTSDPKAVITNVYLSREFANPMPASIKITVE